MSSSAVRTIAFAVLFSAATAGADEPVNRSEPPCPDEGNVVTVIARKRELWLCQQGVAVAKFQVALGRGGMDKRQKDDGRTPVGTYSLGNPRRSVEYGVFIPIAYPTPEQAAQGFTGSGIGIHGPPRGLTEPDYPTTVFDWTRGCVATGLDTDIEVIAEFVRTYQPIVVIR